MRHGTVVAARLANFMDAEKRGILIEKVIACFMCLNKDSEAAAIFFFFSFVFALGKISLLPAAGLFIGLFYQYESFF